MNDINRSDGPMSTFGVESRKITENVLSSTHVTFHYFVNRPTYLLSYFMEQDRRSKSDETSYSGLENNSTLNI